MKTLKLNRMEGIEGGGANGNPLACAGGIILVGALGAAAFVNPLGFALFVAADPILAATATAAGVGAIYENC